MQAKQKSNSKMSDKKQKTRNQGQRPGQQRSAKQGGRASVQRAPVAIGNRTFQSKPRYVSKGDSLIVSHSEYIGDITGSTSTFKVASTVSMNPGLSGSFPWLNQIASRYESYKFRKVHFRFVTERPTTESGYIALVPDFDPTDSAPVDKQTAFQYQSAAKCAPWENLTQICPLQDLHKRQSYFVRQGALLSNETLGLYDTGNLFVCVGGNSGIVNLGELWCDYEVEFMTPQLDSNYGASDSGIIVGGGSTTAAVVFGTTSTQKFGRNTLWSLDPTTGTLTFLQNYQGLFAISLGGTVISALSLTGTAADSGATTSINSAATLLVATFVISALAGQTLIISATATTVTSSSLRAGGYPASLG
jgi:hypothetical protein